MTDNEYRKWGDEARAFYYKEPFEMKFMYYSLWRELMGLLETNLFKSAK